MPNDEFLLKNTTEMEQSRSWGKVDKVVNAYEDNAGSPGGRQTIGSREKKECAGFSEY